MILLDCAGVTPKADHLSYGKFLASNLDLPALLAGAETVLPRVLIAARCAAAEHCEFLLQVLTHNPVPVR
jgi:hypothetical protein